VKTRVCIADGVSVFRAGVRDILLREHDFEVRGAADLAELDEALEGGVDIALIDSELPPAGGRAAISCAKGRVSEIIVWSLRPEPRDVLAAVRGGATGYLRKEISPAGLVMSLRGAARGESPLPRDLTALMIDALHTAESTAQAREVAASLSAREHEVLSHVARGARNKQIAAELTISEFTVKRHVQNIPHKLELPSRRAAGAFYGSLVESTLAVDREAV
jgi:two-component system, NarL family, nitrate/nitrite response regulator NarL